VASFSIVWRSFIVVCNERVLPVSGRLSRYLCICAISSNLCPLNQWPSAMVGVSSSS